MQKLNTHVYAINSNQRLVIQYFRRIFRLHKTHQIKIGRKPNKYKVEEH